MHGAPVQRVFEQIDAGYGAADSINRVLATTSMNTLESLSPDIWSAVYLLGQRVTVASQRTKAAWEFGTVDVLDWIDYLRSGDNKNDFVRGDAFSDRPRPQRWGANDTTYGAGRSVTFRSKPLSANGALFFDVLPANLTRAARVSVFVKPVKSALPNLASVRFIS